ncbi:MAG: pilus assembly protein PilM [Phycisphaerae bacterium]|nr:pilus assembly protein PilM [Phycisphaerae bacterium]NIP50433.1 pilus assembly protein PilM [Phycisphaerae bacterium]NIS49561.1 pilus assembly protein PilM [Phycisphaerae bacterium]NIU07319.1 pilus assembly protein PilM [Phycisphaerae bacterium]NIU54888.1 pilus assembly protein PilM [Phycisphaerae bacterium]
MLQFLKDRTCSVVPILRNVAGLCPVGVNMGDDALTMAQLADNGKGITLVAGDYKSLPPDIKAGSVDWQRWAIETIRQTNSRGQFRGKDVIAAISPSELFIDHIKMPVTDGKSPTKDSVDKAVILKIKQKLPFDPANALIKYIPAEEGHAVVIAAERKIIDRHLAIYEKAGLTIKSIGVWPIAMAKSYTNFFGRRQADVNTVVYLIDIEPNCTNVVICRHENLLLARSISLGAGQLDSDEMVARFVMELDACRRHFTSMYRKAHIERIVFLSGRAVEKEICVTIAKRLEMPAQMGDCLAAVQVADPSETGVDRRDGQVHWAIAFGLSLS